MQESDLTKINEFLALFEEAGFDYTKDAMTQFSFLDSHIPSVGDNNFSLSSILANENKDSFLTIFAKYYLWAINTSWEPGKWKAYSKLFDLLLARAASLDVTPSEFFDEVSRIKADVKEEKLSYLFREYLYLKKNSKFVFFDSHGKLIVCNSLEEAQKKCKEKIKNFNDAYVRLVEKVDQFCEAAAKLFKDNLPEHEAIISDLPELGSCCHPSLQSGVKKLLYIKGQLTVFSNKHGSNEIIEELKENLKKLIKLDDWNYFQDRTIQLSYKTNSNLAPIDILLDGANDDWEEFKVTTPIYQVKPEFIQKFHAREIQENNVKINHPDIYRRYDVQINAGCDIGYNKPLNLSVPKLKNVWYAGKPVVQESEINPQYQKVVELEKYINTLDEKYKSIICFDRDNVKLKMDILKILFNELNPLLKENKNDFSTVIEKWEKTHYSKNKGDCQSILGHHRNWFYQFAKDAGKDDLKTHGETIVENLKSKKP